MLYKFIFEPFEEVICISITSRKLGIFRKWVNCFLKGKKIRAALSRV